MFWCDYFSLATFVVTAMQSCVCFCSLSLKISVTMKFNDARNVGYQGARYPVTIIIVYVYKCQYNLSQMFPRLYKTKK